MNILAIGGSNSQNSINRKFAYYVAQTITHDAIELYDVSANNLPIYSIDKEKEEGIHEIAVAFAAKIDNADLIVLSLAENNGSYNAGFKNLIDWTSRIKERKTWGNKPMLLLSTSPGARGGATVLEGAKNYFPYMGATLVGTFSLPNFGKTFDDSVGIIDNDLKQRLIKIIENIIIS